MKAARYPFYQVAMCCAGHIPCKTDSNIPSLVQALTIWRESIPQTTAMEADCIDVEDFHEYLRGDIMKFLRQGIQLPYELGSLDGDVSCNAAVTLQNITKMLDFLNPRKKIIDN